MANSNPSSPAHFSLAGNFSPEDIQELLGAMTGEQQRPQAESSESVASVERPSSEINNGLEIDDDNKVQARSERKRSREKQRRSDVNRQFSDLTALLRAIEAEESEEDNKARLAFSPTNRVDLIARTISHLERFRDSNKRRKTEVDSLQQQLDQAKKAGEDTAAKLKETMFNHTPPNKHVMMMVPMMLPADGSNNYGSASAQMPMMNHMNPFMMPQPFMTPQMPAGTASQPAVAAAPAAPAQSTGPQMHQMFPGFAMAPQPVGAGVPQGAVSMPPNMVMPQQQMPQQQMPQHQAMHQHIMQPQAMSQAMSFMMPQGGFMAPPQQSMAPTSTVPTRSTSPDTSSDASTSQEQKTSQSQQGINGGSNLAHCA